MDLLGDARKKVNDVPSNHTTAHDLLNKPKSDKRKIDTTMRVSSETKAIANAIKGFNTDKYTNVDELLFELLSNHLNEMEETPNKTAILQMIATKTK